MDQTDYSQGTGSSQGPQFELTETGGWGSRLREWLSQYGSSVILPLVALLILASGIYLYASQKRQQSEIVLEDNPAVTVVPTENTENQEPESNSAIVVTENQDKEDLDQQIVDNITVEMEPTNIEILPAKDKGNSNAMRLKAEKGEGVTHLARKALKSYLQDNQTSSNLTKEHKIYIEDYIKDKIGSKTLEVGEEIEISESLINEAINSSATLTTRQLETIRQFSVAVAGI